MTSDRTPPPTPIPAIATMDEPQALDNQRLDAARAQPGPALAPHVSALPPTRINPRAGGRAAIDSQKTGGQDRIARSPSSMQFDLATADYIGARAQQQDATRAELLASGAGVVLILADGLGGHESGAEAAQIVVDTFGEATKRGAFDAPANRRASLRDVLDQANARIAGSLDPAHGQRSMASTAVVAIVADGALQWISVGDSHLYVWRNRHLMKLNEDHSQAGLMVRSGQYQPDEPEVLAVKSVLVSALTGRKLEIVDHPTQTVKVENGDVLLLASDGLNTLSDREIESIMFDIEARGAADLGKALLETVKDRRADRQDNTTVAIARVLALPAVASDMATTEIVMPASPPTEPRLTAAPSGATPPLRASATAAISPPPRPGQSVGLHQSGFAAHEPRSPLRRSAIVILSLIFGGCLVALILAIAVWVVRPDVAEQLATRLDQQYSRLLGREPTAGRKPEPPTIDIPEPVNTPPPRPPQRSATPPSPTVEPTPAPPRILPPAPEQR